MGAISPTIVRGPVTVNVEGGAHLFEQTNDAGFVAGQLRALAGAIEAGQATGVHAYRYSWQTLGTDVDGTPAVHLDSGGRTMILHWERGDLANPALR